MSLKGQTVRIIVHEPENWDKGNLFGTIVSDRGGQNLILKLSDRIIGNKITSDVLEIKPLNENDTFKPLGQYYSVMVNGSLKSIETEILEYIINGSVTID